MQPIPPGVRPGIWALVAMVFVSFSIGVGWGRVFSTTTSLVAQIVALALFLGFLVVSVVSRQRELRAKRRRTRMAQQGTAPEHRKP